ncbi:alanine-zipper protein [Methylovulum psychrotolerans]|uniref:alanine-zipper protein n=1 Tax=Methylovulum psychrotolerans TaxID=1704499 RepID=UPI001B80C21F|nr:alanine-zipper protein [Methylovulum psychrotolerans]
MRISKLFAVTLLSVLSISCASVSNIANLKAQLDSLNVSVTDISSDTASAKVTALQAAEKATKAKTSAFRSASYEQDVSAKLHSSVCIRRIVKETKKTKKSRKHSK